MVKAFQQFLTSVSGGVVSGTSSLRTTTPPPQIVDSKNDESLINQPTFKVIVKYLKRLKEASRIDRFYVNAGRDLLHPNMRCNQVTNIFIIQCKVMEKKAEVDVPDVTKLQKGTMVASWDD